MVFIPVTDEAKKSRKHRGKTNTEQENPESCHRNRASGKQQRRTRERGRQTHVEYGEWRRSPQNRAQRETGEHHSQPVQRENHERRSSGDCELFAHERRRPSADCDLESALEKEHESHQQDQWVPDESAGGGNRKSLRLLGRRKAGYRNDG